ncbi:MAG: response regulator [Thermomicrobiales bacterium]
MKAAVPAHEAARLAALGRLGLLDTPSEERFDRLTRIARRTFDVPFAFITLVDAERQWNKSRQGAATVAVPRDVSFCAHAILSDGPLVISDATQDPRFAENPGVAGKPGIRFYAGQPLHSPDGYNLGTLCILDRRPRDFGLDDRAALADLAALVEAEFASDLSRQTRQAERALRTVRANAPLVLFAMDRDGRLFLSEGQGLTALGVRPNESVGKTIVERYGADSAPVRAFHRALGGETFMTVLHLGSGIFETHFSPIADNTGAVTGVIGVALDVADRMRDRAALQESEERFRQIAEHIHDAFWISDATQSRMLYISPAYEEIWGRSCQSLYDNPMSFLDTIVPEDRARVAANQRQKRQGGYSEEYRVARPDGAIRWVSSRAFPIRDDQGNVYRVAGVSEDITERKRVEKALRAQARLLDLAHDSIIVRDPVTSAISFWNRGAEETYGWARNEAQGRITHDLLHTRFPVPLADINAALDATGRWEGELVHTARDGRTVIVLSRHTLERDGRGRPTAILEINRDITGRKLAEQRTQEALRQLEEQYQAADRARGESRAVLDSTSEGMALVGPDRRILTINRRFADLFALTADDGIGRQFEEFGAHIERIFADPAAFRARVAGTVADEEHDFTDIVAQRWPEQRELHLFSTPVHAAPGVYLGRLYVLRDITREREVDRMKSEFVSLVSHELRTPLTSIKGFVDLLLDGEVGEVSEEQREFLEIVRNNADRLVALINDLLDVSRIESGRVELRRLPLDLARLVHAAAGALRLQIEAKQQTLTLAVPATLPRVSADPDRLTQILTNLLSNAYKYTPPGGAIRLGATASGGMVRVEITDTGVGMTPEEQAQVFTRFFRAQNRATQEAGGTGLGLVITRSLVEMHGGEISLTSAPGTGSTFRFTLPVAEEEAAPPTTRELTLREVGRRILVVDDEQDIATLIRRYLERAGYSVLVARDATIALQLAREEAPDLITLDISLPGADGLTLLEWLKSDPLTAAIPVVLLSILDDTGRGKLLGAVDYLAKPVNEGVLLDRVRAILAQSAAGRPHRILVADDERDLRTLVAGGLRWAGYDVFEAGDGEEALAIARREQLDLILLDIRMPRLDGMGVLRALRADEATRTIPVVVMTASPGALEENRSAIEALGGRVLLSKPCTPQELATAIVSGDKAASGEVAE